MTGVTPGAFVIASRCTSPIRPIPITPTLIMGFVSPLTIFICNLDLLEELDVAGRKAVLVVVWRGTKDVEKADASWTANNNRQLLLNNNAVAAEAKTFMVLMV